jgi:hypothetical protein
MLKKIAFWVLIIGVPAVLILDLIIHLKGGVTISQQLWLWSATGPGRLIPFGLGFLSCHLILGSSGNG